MYTLQHVCVWSENGWKRISAEEAARLHPGGTVSAHSGLFMCELCGQYVLLTDGELRIRHFRHSSYEESKDCPDRANQSTNNCFYKPKDHELPIRIGELSSTSFTIEIGLIRIPANYLADLISVTISSKLENNYSLRYSRERIYEETTTYLPLFDIPYAEYKLNIDGGTKDIYNYWPKEVKGIESSGSFFDIDTHKLLPYDSDIEIGKEYLFMTKDSNLVFSKSHKIECQLISSKSTQFGKWYIYSLTAKEMNERAAKFYWNHRCRLTEQAISIQPVWPLYIEGDYVIKHNQNKMAIHITGNYQRIMTFPKATIDSISNGNNLYMVECKARQQLISAGRIKALKYTYYWQEELKKRSKAPSVIITDINGKDLNESKITDIPPSKIIQIKSGYDGKIVILYNNEIKEIRPLNADSILELDELTFGIKIQIYIGLDKIREIEIERDKTINISYFNEMQFLRVIESKKGSVIPVPHAIKNIAFAFSAYPKIFEWITGKIKSGYIYKSAFKILQYYYLKMEK